ncbi:hypothetical protein ACFL6C_11340 [Myxococcota bacterium]
MIALAFLGGCVVSVIPTCDGGGLTMVLEGVEVEVRPESFVLKQPSSDEEASAKDSLADVAAEGVLAAGSFANDAGETVAFRLVLAAEWVLRWGEQEARLKMPGVIREPGQVEILGVAPNAVWVAAPGVVARVVMKDAVVEAGRVGRRRHVPQPLAVGEDALLVTGNQVLRCSAPRQCRTLGRLPMTVDGVVNGPGGWLLAGSGSEPGLYRALANAPLAASLLIAGEVVALCGTGDGDSWAVVRRGQEVRLVAASVGTPAVRPFAPSEILTQGLTDTQVEPDVVGRVLDTARRQRWPQLERMVLNVMHDTRAAARRHAAEAAGDVSGARGTAVLWLLGRDPDPSVRLEALRASASRCVEDVTLSCIHALATFVGDDESEVAWTARDVMLDHDPLAALRGAPAGYKLDAISTLVARLQRHGGRSVEQALELLAGDRDPRVRTAARLALSGWGP